MTRALGRNCGGCRYWSEMIARAIGGADVEAYCLGPGSPYRGHYTKGRQTCEAFAKNSHGAVDDPHRGPDAVAEYEREANTIYPNGNPVFSKDGTMLDERGNRSVFDDIDE